MRFAEMGRDVDTTAGTGMVVRVIVPLDGTPLAETAIGFGLALARSSDGELVLVQSTWHDPPDQEVHYLRNLVDGVGYDRTSYLTAHGFADVGIHDLMADVDGAVLCLATRGHAGIGGIVLGSVAHDIMAGAGGPVVVIGPGCRGHEAAEPLRGSFVYAFDASPGSAALEPIVARWAVRLGLPVRVVTVLHHDGEYLGDLASDDVRHATSRVVARLRAAGVSTQAVELEGLDVAGAICDDAAAHGAALIAAGATSQRASHGAARLTRALLGSTADRVIRHAGCPVLVLRS